MLYCGGLQDVVFQFICYRGEKQHIIFTSCCTYHCCFKDWTADLVAFWASLEEKFTGSDQDMAPMRMA